MGKEPEALVAIRLRPQTREEEVDQKREEQAAAEDVAMVGVVVVEEEEDVAEEDSRSLKTWTKISKATCSQTLRKAKSYWTVTWKII